MVAVWGRNESIDMLILAWMLPLLGLFTALYANWYWLA